MPSELFFLSEDEARFLIVFKGNTDRIVGTIATTYEKNMAELYEGEQELMKRRTLHMRTGQLLSSRVHTPFDVSIERIYGNSITKNATTTNLDHAILSITNFDPNP